MWLRWYRLSRFAFPHILGRRGLPLVPLIQVACNSNQHIPSTFHFHSPDKPSRTFAKSKLKYHIVIGNWFVEYLDLNCSKCTLYSKVFSWKIPNSIERQNVEEEIFFWTGNMHTFHSNMRRYCYDSLLKSRTYGTSEPPNLGSVPSLLCLIWHSSSASDLDEAEIMPRWWGRDDSDHMTSVSFQPLFNLFLSLSTSFDPVPPRLLILASFQPHLDHRQRNCFIWHSSSVSVLEEAEMTQITWSLLQFGLFLLASSQPLPLGLN